MSVGSSKPVPDLQLWDNKSVNIGELNVKARLLDAEGKPWLQSLNSCISTGTITGKDIKLIKKGITTEGRREKTLHLCNELFVINKIAKKEKIIQKETFEHSNRFKNQIVSMLAECTIDEIVNNISDPDLFNLIIKEKSKTQNFDFVNINKIIHKELEGSKLDSSSLEDSIMQLTPRQFIQVVNKLNDSEIIEGNDVEDYVKQKIQLTDNFDHKIFIINKFEGAINIKDVIEGFKSISLEDGKNFISKCNKLSVQNRPLLFQKFLNVNKDLNLNDALTLFHLLKLPIAELTKQFTALVRVCDVKNNDYLSYKSIRDVLQSPAKCEVAAQLCIANPKLLLKLFGDNGICEQTFTMQEKLEVLRKAITQTTDFKQFNIKALGDFTRNLIDSGYDDFPQEAFSCLVAINKKDHNYLIALLKFCTDNNQCANICMEIDKPSLMALQREEGRAETTQYADIMRLWNPAEKKEYLDALLRDPATQQLFLTRVNTGSQLKSEEQIQYVLKNLDKIPFEDAIAAVKAKFGTLSGKSNSLLVEVLKGFDLDSIKHASPGMNKAALTAIEERIKGHKGLESILGTLVDKGKKDDYVLAKSLFAFAYLLDQVKVSDQKGFEELLKNPSTQALIIEIATLRKPDEARFFLMNRFIENVEKANKGDRNALTLISREAGAQDLIKLQLSSFYDTSNLNIEHLFGKNKAFKADTDYLSTILETLQAIHRDPILTQSDKQYLVDFITRQVPSNVALDSKTIKSYLSSVKSILQLGGAGYLGRESLEKAFEGDRGDLLSRLGAQVLSELMQGNLSKEVSAVLIKKISQSRDPNWVLDIAAKLNTLDPVTKEAHLKVFAEALTEDVNGTFTNERFDKSPHLLVLAEKLQNVKGLKGFVDKWKTPILNVPLTVAGLLAKRPIGGGKKLEENVKPKLESKVRMDHKYEVKKHETDDVDNYQVLFSDDFLDLTQMGTEVVGSCLNLKTGKPIDVMTILGNAIDGKTRMLAVKKTGASGEPLEGRVMLRVLWDEKAQTPVLMLEGIRTRKPLDQREAQTVNQALFAASIKVAESLNIPLICGFTAEPQPGATYKPYPNEVQSLAPNRSPSEKFDPLEEQGGPAVARTPKEVSGHYTVAKSSLIWAPTK